MSRILPNLPIIPVLDELRTALRSTGRAVLQAPPGAGKTTLVPLALLDEPWLAAKKIVMLEPRRLAARGAAWRIAELLGEDMGERVGYRMRGETRVGPRTRIEVVTEGILTRMLQGDPSLEEIGLVIFDEFHERSLHADLGLAFILQACELFRSDLRVLVMSATLEGEPIAQLLGNAPIITSQGRSFPVETRYVPREPDTRLEIQTAQTIVRALREEPEGDILVFLPGYGEIRRTEELLGARLQKTEHTIEIHPLHGTLPRQQQDRAIRPAAHGVRKIVLSTSIAETSLTIEGVRVVVDAGLSRVPRFSPRSGMTGLETVRVSRSSAEQRRGRAGRLGPGVCYRLWSEAEEAGLLPSTPPEILEADLAPLALELFRWGSAPEELRWLDPPPAGPYAAACELLRELDALEGSGHLTPHGERMAALPIHPRLAHMVLRAAETGNAEQACLLAALLEERDILRGTTPRRDPDLRLRIELLERFRQRDRGLPQELDRTGAERVLEGAKRLRSIVGEESKKREQPTDFYGAESGRLLAFAYPDRIAQRRTGSAERYLLRNGRGVRLPETGHLSGEEYLVAAGIGGKGAEGTIELAGPISAAEIREIFAGQIRTLERADWEGGERGVAARREEQLGALLLSSSSLENPSEDAIVAATIRGVREQGLRILPWTRELQDLCLRSTFLHRRYDPNWPEMTDGTLADRLEEWLRPALYGLPGRNRLKRLDLKGALLNLLDWEQARDLEKLAPERLPVPSGSFVRLDYSTPDEPVLPVRLQEMFGAHDTPRIAGGRVPVTLHLLSPAQRPVQVTQDLAGFWHRTYAEVKKELKGRYPKHYWPDDPLQAEPTRGTKRKKPEGKERK